MELPEFIEQILIPMNKQEGDSLPVSAFDGIEDGTFPSGTAAYEKRGVAAHLPEWVPENCIQCNQCSFVCPHAAIRPMLLDEKEKAAAPAGFETVQARGKGMEGLPVQDAGIGSRLSGSAETARISVRPRRRLS